MTREADLEGGEGRGGGGAGRLLSPATFGGGAWGGVARMDGWRQERAEGG